MWRFLKGLLIFSIIIFLSCEKGEIIEAVDPVVELHAVYVTSEPIIDGYGDDDVWQQTKPFTVHVFDNPEQGESLNLQSGFNVTLKAIWWKNWMMGSEQWIERPFLSILLTWPDDEKNITNSMWQYNPVDTTWKLTQTGSDWLLFAWDMASNYTDIWFWDAALTNPLGFAEDEYIEYIALDSTSYVGIFNIDGANYLNDFGEYKNSWDLNYNNNFTPRDSTDDFPKMAWAFDIDSIAPSMPRFYSSENEKYSFLLAQDADLLKNTI